MILTIRKFISALDTQKIDTYWWYKIGIDLIFFFSTVMFEGLMFHCNVLISSDLNECFRHLWVINILFFAWYYVYPCKMSVTVPICPKGFFIVLFFNHVDYHKVFEGPSFGEEWDFLLLHDFQILTLTLCQSLEF